MVATAPHRLHVILVPGLFSPRWIMVPMGRFLRSEFDQVRCWDHPTVFGPLQRSHDALLSHITNNPPNDPVALITHSFGDWITRRVLADLDQQGDHRVSHLVSLSPVTTSNPAAITIGKLTKDRIPEIAVMRDADRASQCRRIAPHIHHLTLWSRIDPWVNRCAYLSPQTIEHRVWATHNSINFQPGVWRRVATFLKTHGDRPRDRTAVRTIANLRRERSEVGMPCPVSRSPLSQTAS